MLHQLELDAAPKIMLGGREFPVPMLAPRQQRIVVPRIIKLMKTFAEKGKFGVTDLTEDLYDEICVIVHSAVTRGTPELTKDQFMDLPIDPVELIRAIDVIAQATGVLRRAKPGEAATADQSGEASARNTGTASSPA